MKLSNVLLRYDPPGIGLEFTSSNSDVIITVDLEDMNEKSDISELTNDILKQYLSSAVEYKDVIYKSLSKIQKFIVKDDVKFVKSDILLEHILPVTNIAINEQNDKIVTGCYDRICRIWDLNSGELVQNLKGHNNVVYSVAFSKKINGLLTGSYDKSSILWDLKGGNAKQKYVGHSGEVVGAQFVSRDEDRLCSISTDKTARVYQSETGQEMLCCSTHTAEIVALQICEIGNTMVTGSFDKTLCVWDLRENKCMAVLKGHEGEISCCKIDYDGLTVVSSSFDMTAKLWDLRMMKCCHTYIGHEDEVVDIEYNWKKNLIATASVDGTARLWDSFNSFDLKATLRGHQKSVLKIAFNPPGDEVITCSEDNTARVWKIKNSDTGNGISIFMKQVLQHGEQVFAGLYSECNSKIVTACKDNTCKMWNRVK